MTPLGALLVLLSPAFAAPVPSAGTPVVSSGTPIASSAQSAAVVLQKLAFATGIADRMPVGEATSFPRTVGQVYCWNLLRTRRNPTKIKHVWKRNGVKAAEFTLKVDFAVTRVWTGKRVTPGNWTVDIADESGALIAVAAFPVD